ncbi:FKBP-type peptidyl-prolyl cis-trans isomerase [Ktedonospora formicarum]|uniref:Peptidyl-prolyl cis-trans isomerase n=1 Tax=Ktedonospora formicarum TaxID=2778364 RepID=A0A8J3I2U3_9CHLR|nr:FKBP-type peptidyl-prolyl cis-trans isomerase [Ktedonospora formicarum]GHO45683.1 hypothetical protein KSX_38460 [Ktedonospora formicarum]
MSQTIRSEKDPSPKQGRPGQRQQERINRKERRKRRARTWTVSIVAVVLIALGVWGIVQYQQYNNQLALAASKSATATADAKGTAEVKATATGIANAVQTATGGSPTPSAGPDKPPVVDTSKTVKTKSGLQYIDVKTGNGKEVTKGSTVKVEYTGWLESNGKKFDSSYDRKGELFELANVGNASVIPGWNEGLIGMKAGGTRRLIIPPDLGYGKEGSGDVIPPNSTIVFDVTVVTVS